MIKRVSLAAVLLLTLSVASQAQTIEQLGTINGRVTMHGKPVKGSLVLVWRQPFEEPFDSSRLTGNTDVQGKYRIKNVPPGNYYISVQSPGNLIAENGRPVQSLRAVVITDADNLENVDFQLVKGGVITGKVVSSDDKPLPEVTVTVLPVTEAKNSARPSSKRPDATRTDDRGVYRIYGLAPGKYRIAAGETVTAYASYRGGIALARTYYPNTVDENKATAFGLGAGQVLTGINIKAGTPEPSFSIAGKLIDDQTGAPLPNVAYAVEIYGNGDMRGSINGLNFSNSRGEFVMDGLTPGTYRIAVPSFLIIPNAELLEHFGSSDEIQLVDQDIEDVVVKLSKTATVSGVIKVVGTSEPAAFEKMRSLPFHLYSIQVGQRIFSTRFVVNSDNTFLIRGVRPGKLGINLNPPRVGQSIPFRLLKLETGVMNSEEIEVKAGEELSDLTIVLSYANASLRGTIKLPSSDLVGKLSGQVVLYSDKTLIASGPIDSRGEFIFQDIPAGNFKLVTTAQVPGSQTLLKAEQFVEVVAGKMTEVIVTPLIQN
jgi:hypothetical protein